MVCVIYVFVMEVCSVYTISLVGLEYVVHIVFMLHVVYVVDMSIRVVCGIYVVCMYV